MVNLFRVIGLVLSIQVANGATNFTFGGDLVVWLYSPSIIRVSKLPPVIHEQPTLISSRMVEYIPHDVKYQMSQNGDTVTITTDELSIRVDNTTKLVSFYDQQNQNKILSESATTFFPAVDLVLNDSMYNIQQEWTFTDKNTALFGFGSFQNGLINYRDQTVRCVQFNTEICIPMLISTSNYGIFWDNNGATTLNNNTLAISNWTVKHDTSWFNMSTAFTASHGAGSYSFFLDFNDIFAFGAYASSQWDFLWQLSYSTDGGNTYIVYDSFGIGYVEMPSSFSIPKLHLNDSQTIHLLLKVNNTYQEPLIFYRYESNSFDIASLLSNYIDYYYIASSSSSQNAIDDIIGQYRVLTGGAPQLYSINVYGFWHSQNAFKTQQQVLQCAEKYRTEQYPVDNIVQDFYYWGNAAQWGPQFNPTNYPDPAGMVKSLHSMNFKFMISVWPMYGRNTSFYAQCLANNYLINPTIWLDVYQRAAADRYYYYINQSMFSIDVDYIWADSTEPDNFPNENRSFLGNIPNDMSNDTLITLSGNVLINPYSKYVIKSLYDGYTSDYSEKRVFALTRSATGGQEKYGSTVWTGDISNEWDVLRRQITASINYPFTGNNYWANDIGGFYRYCNATNSSAKTNSNCYTNIAYHRLMIRWFQFGVFVPLYRVHGYGNTAPYNFGEIARNYTLIATNLRYRLLPYIYTLAYMVRYENYTMQRALVFDFYNDPNLDMIHNNYNQFMFGPNLLVAPLYDDSNTTEVYLPSNNASVKSVWWNFWTGESVAAGSNLHLNVPLSEIPIYVKGGSVLVLGPMVQYSNEKEWSTLEVRVYRGADGQFVLFEDDFFTRNTVESDQYTMIPFNYKDSTEQLVIGDRIGSYSTMIHERTFEITLVSQGHGVGVNVTTNPTKTVSYTGKAITVDLN